MAEEYDDLVRLILDYKKIRVQEMQETDYWKQKAATVGHTVDLHKIAIEAQKMMISPVPMQLKDSLNDELRVTVNHSLFDGVSNLPVILKKPSRVVHVGGIEKSLEDEEKLAALPWREKLERFIDQWKYKLKISAKKRHCLG